MSDHSSDVDLDALRRRAWESTVPADGDDEAQARSRIAWLERMTPEDWHRFAQGFNWSDEIEPLFWIARQDRCDMATALHIFWHSCPEYELMEIARGDKVYERSEAPMIEYIARRIAAKGYKRRKIAWDPTPMMKGDFAEMQADIAKIANPPWPVHRDLLRSIWGKEIVDSEEAWEERPAGVRTGFWLNLPPSNIVTPRMHEAYDEMRTVFVNLWATGAVLAAFFEFAKDPGKYWIYILVAVAAFCIHAYNINTATATVRSLIRSELIQVPIRQMALVFAALIILGVVWMHSYFAHVTILFNDTAGTFEGQAFKAVVIIAYIAPAWFGLRWLAQPYTYRCLFR